MLTESDLRPKQLPAIDFMYKGDQTLLFADVGTGKTIMALTVLQEWIKEGICERALVVGPKRVCVDTWMAEPDEWEQIDRDIVRLGCLAGRSVEERLEWIYDSSANVLLINYELLPWLMAEFPDGVPGVNVLMPDEIDKLKEHTSKRFKGTKRHKNKKTGEIVPRVPGMQEWRDHFEIHVGMTGTPQPNKLLELWAQVYVIDGGKRLGDNFYEFRNRHFYQTDWAGYDYAPLPGREQWIYDQIADITYRIAVEPGKDTPHVIELPVRWLDMPKKAKAVYKELERNFVVELQRTRAGHLPLDLEDTAEVSAEDGAAVLYGKLRQMAQGFAYLGEDDEAFSGRDSEWLFKDKYTELDSLISELQGQQLMIVYHYKEQLTELVERYGDALRYLGGGISDKAAKHTIDLWNAGTLPLLALHPASAGHGLNLQKSGAHHVVMLTLPESAGLYTQVIGRLARGGNPVGEVMVHRILMRGTVDEERDAVVHGKIQDQADLLAAMESRQ